MLTNYSGTSKSEFSIDSYGRFGRFLSSISVLALLSITSRYKSESHTSRLIFRRGQVVYRKLKLDEAGFDIGRSGTKIEVHNLFGDIPVRSKHMYDRYSSTAEIERTFDHLRGILTGYLLACSGQIDLCCIVNGTARKLVHRRPTPFGNPSQLTPKMVASVLSQTRSGPTMDSKRWRYASVRTTKYFISAVISVEPAPSPFHQYISLGNIPIHAQEDHSFFFKTINDRFQASTFSQHPDSLPAKGAEMMAQGAIAHNPGHINGPKRVDRWPVFYIRVDGLANREARQLSREYASFALKDVNNSIAQALESLVSHFLEVEGWKSASNTTSNQELNNNGQRHDANKNLRVLTRRTTKLAHVDSSSQFSQWHRIKAGHSRPADMDYGLPFAKSTRSHCTDTKLARESQLLYETLSSDEAIPVSEESICAAGEGSTSVFPSFANTSEKDCGEEGSAWTNPRTGRTSHINPRTGATIIDGHQQVNTTIPPSSRVTGSGKTSQTYTLDLHRADSPSLVPVNAVYAPNLKPYGQTHIIKREAAIPVVGPDGPLASNQKLSTYLFHESSQSSQVSKEDLSQARVLGQVDKKFILISVQTLLILIDQHAADERVKLEQLCHELCMGNPITLGKPLVYEIEEDEAPLFRAWREYFQKWHISYVVVEEEEDDDDDDGQSRQVRQGQGRQQSKRVGVRVGRGVYSIRVRVDALPQLVAERCRAEPKLLIELLRKELFSDQARNTRKLHTDTRSASRSVSGPESESQQGSWLRVASSCPLGVLELLKSRSCRTAIMFNDGLEMEECEELVRRLAKCDLPFQCAHGRPTLSVLTEFGGLGGCHQPENRGAGPDGDAGAGADPDAGAERDAEALGYRQVRGGVGFGAAWQKWTARRS